MGDTSLMKNSMRLFGLPYQFTSAVDPRISSISNTVGRKFMENIMLEGPICTIIPGKPKYLPADTKSQKLNTTEALLSGASSTTFGGLQDLISNNKSLTSDQLRLYDFERSYTEYMKYVNILCRTGAAFLEIKTKLDGKSFQKYDWRNYRRDGSSYTSTVSNVINGSKKGISNILDKIRNTRSKSDASSGNTGGTYGFLYNTTNGNTEDQESLLEDMFKQQNYVQFYVDPDVSCDESMNNSTSESMMKSALDSGASTLKEIAFMTNSGGVSAASGLQDFAESTSSGLSTALNSMVGGDGITSQGSAVLSRILNLGGQVIKGNNVIMPDIYQSSQYSKSYSLTVHLRSPYGSKLGYYYNIFVPLMHLLALAIPKQETANTYSSPFLIKAYVEGLFTCNMGIVQSISIARSSESRSVDGLPTEVDVTLSITDLYSDLTMSPQSDPILFINNSSLIEYLATNCGLSLISPQLTKKINMSINATVSSVTSIPTTIGATIQEKIDNVIAGFTGLK